MKVNIRLYGILRDKLPAADKGKATLDLEVGTTVGEVLTQLDIEQAVAVAVNEDTEIDRSFQLSNGDEMAVFSVIGGG